MGRFYSMGLLFLIALSALTQVMAFAEEGLTAREIADRAYDSSRVAGYEATSTLTIIDSKGRERVRKTAVVSKLYDEGETEKRLVRFLEPADVKGTGLLTFDYKEKDDDIWLYMPGLRKIRRVVSSEKAQNFMGSEFSYADMTPPTLDDFEFELLGEETVDGTPCWKIEMRAKNDDIADANGFLRRISWIGKQDFVTRRALYYDLEDTLHKELRVSDVLELDPEHHKYRAKRMEMENKQNGRRSILQIDQIQLNLNVKDEYFTTRYLERG